ncbi:MAG TPA: polysaccharide biosynthesis tyrosine autokinase [Candidatus Acidoferrales bacterium]|jgi:succinoglycan biosynthesis transport protein ExoP|nr:polysaccharide biosynthesis tyrosine autokinase [Candidatus Acidoferrales bacterium]
MTGPEGSMQSRDPQAYLPSGARNQAPDGWVPAPNYAPGYSPSYDGFEAPATPVATVALDELTRRLWRRRLPIACAAILGALAALLVSKLQTPVFQAITSVQLEGINQDYFLRDVLPISPLLANASAQNYLENQVKVLQSRTLAARVAEKLKDRLKASAKPSLAARLAEYLPISRPQQGAANDLTKRVRDSLSVRTSLQSQVIEIAYEDADPVTAAAAANAAVAEFVAMNREARWQSVEDTTQSLGAQTADLKLKLEKAGRELVRYARESGLVFAGQAKATLGEDRMRQLEDALTKAEADRVGKQSRYEAAVASPMEALPDTIATGPLRQYQTELEAARRELAENRTLYTPAHYKVKRLEARVAALESAIAQERKAIVARLQTEYSAAQRTEHSLSQTHGTQLRAIQSETEKQAQYDILKREVETTQRLYDSVLEKAKEAGVASALGGASIRVIDRAVPPRLPYKPNLPLASSLGFAIGILGGIGLAIVGSRSAKVSHPGDLAFPEVRELGMIPSAKHDKELSSPRRIPSGLSRLTDDTTRSSVPPLSRAGQGLELATWQRENSMFAESFRAALTSLLFSLPGREKPTEGTQPTRAGRVLVITSAEPMEGKTTVLSNLAIACAETRRRVLLIDADLRRPRLHDIFEVCNDSGVADIILSAENSSSMDLQSYTRTTSVPNLWVMPSGPALNGVSGLLHSAALNDLLARCRQEFDLVLVDSPPMMLYPDARVLGKTADGVVLVVRADRTSRDELVRTCYQVLIKDRITILGTVFNGFRVSSERQRAYTDYYRRYGRSGDGNRKGTR